MADDVPTSLEERNVRRRDPEGDVVHHLGEFQMATADEEMEKAFDYYDEDDGSLLDPSQVRAGMDRERELMTSLDVAERVRRDEVPPGTKIWSGRWCHRRKAGGVRSRYVIRQYKTAVEQDAFSGTPGWTAIRLLLVMSVIEKINVVVGDFSVAFMHTPLEEEEERVYVEAPIEFEPHGTHVWFLKKALNGLKRASLQFQNFLFNVLTLQMGLKQGNTDSRIPR